MRVNTNKPYNYPPTSEDRWMVAARIAASRQLFCLILLAIVAFFTTITGRCVA